MFASGSSLRASEKDLTSSQSPGTHCCQRLHGGSYYFGPSRSILFLVTSSPVFHVCILGDLSDLSPGSLHPGLLISVFLISITTFFICRNSMEIFQISILVFVVLYFQISILLLFLVFLYALNNLKHNYTAFSGFFLLQVHGVLILLFAYQLILPHREPLL